MLGLFFWFTARQNFGGVLADFLEYSFYYCLLLPLASVLPLTLHFSALSPAKTLCVFRIYCLSQEYWETLWNT